jgi:hypothetical protein
VRLCVCYQCLVVLDAYSWELLVIKGNALTRGYKKGGRVKGGDWRIRGILNDAVFTMTLTLNDFLWSPNGGGNASQSVNRKTNAKRTKIDSSTQTDSIWSTGSRGYLARRLRDIEIMIMERLYLFSQVLLHVSFITFISSSGWPKSKGIGMQIMGSISVRDGIHQIVSRFLERFCYLCSLLFSCVFPS